MITKTKGREVLERKKHVRARMRFRNCCIDGMETIQIMKKMEMLVEDLIFTKKCELVRNFLWFL